MMTRLKNHILHICISAILAMGSCTRPDSSESQENPEPESPMILAGYKEPRDPSPSRDASWRKLSEPLYAGFGSINERYPRTRVPGMEAQSAWEATAWGGERVYAQIILWATEDVAEVEVEVSDLSSDTDAFISASQIRTGFVRYVMTDEFAGGCQDPETRPSDSSLVADMIDPLPAMDIPARTVRPVWVTIQVPSDANPGQYRGTITVKNSGRIKTLPLTLTLNVLERRLSEPENWGFQLDLWQNPFSVSRVYGVENWSDAHFAAMEPYMKMLAKAGQKVITASIIHDPWNGQTYDIYDSMIRWVKKTDGSWEYDYTVFDKWVQFMMDLGIDQQINCYSMIPWNLKFYYYDEQTGKDTVLVAEPGTPEFADHWTPMLKDFASHLKQKGWFNITTIAMDERPPEHIQEVIRLIKSVDSTFKIALAGNYHPEIEPDIYDYCLASSQKISRDTLRIRERDNKVTTYYTCCVEPYPNTFTFSPPAEATWLAWHAAAKNYDGYLRWAYNCWGKDPIRDSRFGKTLPAGDTYLIYPGPRSSIRFEMLIDGIEDYEKIRILKAELSQKGDTDTLMEIQKVLDAFSDIERLKENPAGEMLSRAREKLNQF